MQSKIRSPDAAVTVRKYRSSAIPHAADFPKRRRAQSLYCAVSSAIDDPHVPHPTDRRNKAIAPYLRCIRAHPARAGEEAVDKADHLA
jgi:hypothetical protein